MYGLMSRWFAAPAGLPLDGGYFYLCPPCFDETIEPHLEELLDVLREHLPAPKPAQAGEATDAPPQLPAPGTHPGDASDSGSQTGRRQAPAREPADQEPPSTPPPPAG